MTIDFIDTPWPRRDSGLTLLTTTFLHRAAAPAAGRPPPALRRRATAPACTSRVHAPRRRAGGPQQRWDTVSAGCPAGRPRRPGSWPASSRPGGAAGQPLLPAPAGGAGRVGRGGGWLAAGGGDGGEGGAELGLDVVGERGGVVDLEGDEQVAAGLRRGTG